MRPLLALSFSLLLSPLAHAQIAPAPFVIGGEHQFDADLDGGGSFSRSTFRVRASAPLLLNDETIVGLSAGYQLDSFDFDGTAPAPWNDIHRMRLSLIAKSDFNDSWSWILLPWIASNAESGADWDQSLRYGGLGGVWHELNDRLTLGLGAGASSRLEDNLGVFPVLLLDWKVTDSITLSTLPPEGFRVAPAVSLRWDACEDVTLALVYLYQSQQHRLDENSLASANGVGELRQHRIALSATYRIGEHFRVTGNAGLAFGGELELQNAVGRTIAEREFDSSFVIGIEGSVRF